MDYPCAKFGHFTFSRFAFIALNMVLHFLTVTFNLLTYIHWWVKYRDGLSLCKVWRFSFKPFLFYRADRQTDRITHTHTDTDDCDYRRRQ